MRYLGREGYNLVDDSAQMYPLMFSFIVGQPNLNARDFSAIPT